MKNKLAWGFSGFMGLWLFAVIIMATTQKPKPAEIYIEQYQDGTFNNDAFPKFKQDAYIKHKQGWRIQHITSRYNSKTWDHFITVVYER